MCLIVNNILNEYNIKKIIIYIYCNDIGFSFFRVKINFVYRFININRYLLFYCWIRFRLYLVLCFIKCIYNFEFVYKLEKKIWNLKLNKV